MKDQDKTSEKELNKMDVRKLLNSKKELENIKKELKLYSMYSLTTMEAKYK